MALFRILWISVQVATLEVVEPRDGSELAGADPRVLGTFLVNQVRYVFKGRGGIVYIGDAASGVVVYEPLGDPVLYGPLVLFDGRVA